MCRHPINTKQVEATAAVVLKATLIQPRAMSKHQQRQRQQQHQHPFFDYASVRENSEDEQFDPLANLVSLQLHKPPNWNLELSTSRSCSNIALPRIILYDDRGVLLLDANGNDEQTYRITTAPNQSKSTGSNRSRVGNELDELSVGQSTPTGRYIDFSTHELADSHIPQGFVTRRSSSLEGRENQEGHRQSQQQLRKLCTSTPTSALDNSSSTGTQEKRRYRRSHSSGHRSILERFSMSRGRMSSPEYCQEESLERAPRYFLRSSKAGTLVIKDESFSQVHQRRRRKNKDSSNDNLLKQEDKSPSENVVLVTSRRRLPHHQSSRQPLLSTSDDDVQPEIRKQLRTRRK